MKYISMNIKLKEKIHREKYLFCHKTMYIKPYGRLVINVKKNKKKL